MPRWIALLRGINVGGKAIVRMEELRALLEKAGFTGVKTLLQSGNVVFEGKSKASVLEHSLEKELGKKFGREIEVFVRDTAAWKKIIAGNPFVEEARQDPSHLVVMCLKAIAGKDALAALQAGMVGREVFRAGGNCLYIYYPDGIGESKLTNAVIERKLGVSGTARNWNTVVKIAALLEG